MIVVKAISLIFTKLYLFQCVQCSTVLCSVVQHTTKLYSTVNPPPKKGKHFRCHMSHQVSGIRYQASDVWYYVLGVRCQVLGVMCCASHVTCHLSHVTNANSHSNGPSPCTIFIIGSQPSCLAPIYCLADSFIC